MLAERLAECGGELVDRVADRLQHAQQREGLGAHRQLDQGILP
jgi:hypothetical protein